MNTDKKMMSIASFTSMALTVALSATIQSTTAQPFVLKKNTDTLAETALVPHCATAATGEYDGVPTTKGDPDGVPTAKGDPDGVPTAKGDPDGKAVRKLKTTALTTPTAPDLAISRVNATLETTRYTLSFCVFNRGGKPAFSPTALVVQAGDVVLQELTIFESIPSLGGLCFGSGDREQLPPTAKTAGATIQVTAATGETALLNNKCRIQWGK